MINSTWHSARREDTCVSGSLTVSVFYLHFSRNGPGWEVGTLLHVFINI